MSNASVKLAILTSGGDAPGMNAAVRAAVRTALFDGARVYGVHEGFQGLVDGGRSIEPLDWGSVSGILQLGGTHLGSARCADFRTPEGRLKAARNLVERGIDRLIVVGGDGSLTGANVLRKEWGQLKTRLVEAGAVTAEEAEALPNLTVVGLPGSIDNDFAGTDVTIGTDTALHRIVAAVDAVYSTASSHRRAFVIEVMGRNCGYLALTSGLACGAEWILIPEDAPDGATWKRQMAERLQAGRQVGRRASIVILSEGACDRQGNRITADDVRQALVEELGEDARVTILGHVQRGGAPSAFDRNLGTFLGQAAAREALAEESRGGAWFVGLVANRPQKLPLPECVERCQEVALAVEQGDYERAMKLRGGSFARLHRTWSTLVQAHPRQERGSKRVAILHCGGPAPGMNMAVRASVRLLLDRGHTPLGVTQGFRGLGDGHLKELDWMSVTGWSHLGGAELGTHPVTVLPGEFYHLARSIENHHIDAILMIGGWAGYESVFRIYSERNQFPAFNIPMVCMPATIDNNLPGCELSVGADTALNSIVWAVDRIKQSAVATNRCFVVDVMGHDCGYLALTSGLATGAEQVYLNETSISISDLLGDLSRLSEGFRMGRRLGLVIRNEKAHPLYDTDFICALFEEEGGDLFDVRQAILGHLQQGGDPTPFDRLLAVRFAVHCVEKLDEELSAGGNGAYFMGREGFLEMDDFPRLVERDHHRPRKQWWMQYQELASLLGRGKA